MQRAIQPAASFCVRVFNPQASNAMPLPQREVSIESSEAIALAYVNYVSEDDPRTADPFDIVAQLEEELGYPLALQ